MNSSIRYFSDSYSHARRQFQDAADLHGLPVESHVLPGHTGVAGEALATDVLRIGARDAARLLVISSATHGVEGFCGSGCQVALLHDEELLGRIRSAGVALLLVHAVNPFGFSHWHRTNEDNVDVNRNFVDFGRALPANAHYAELEPHLLPPSWPPSADDEASLRAFAQQHGEAVYGQAIGGGQYDSPTGIYHGGQFPVWSNRTMRAILQAHGRQARALGWIDLHTGMGPTAHCEKVFIGVPSQLARARQWWGSDVFSAAGGESVLFPIRGPLLAIAEEECPQAEATTIALEFGTVPLAEMIMSLRGLHWLKRHPDCERSLAIALRQRLLDAFYMNDPHWKSAVLAQFRVATLQALEGLRASGQPVAGALDFAGRNARK
jgi:hypothetical protein